MPIINGIEYKSFDIPDPDNLIEARDDIESNLEGNIDSAIRLLKEKKQLPGARLTMGNYDCGCYHDCRCRNPRLLLVYKRPRYAMEYRYDDKGNLLK